MTMGRATDTLNRGQRARAAAAYEAARLILAEDPPPEDIVRVADYIVTGNCPPPDINVLPSRDLLEQVVQRVAKYTAEHFTSGDQSRTPRPVGTEA